MTAKRNIAFVLALGFVVLTSACNDPSPQPAPSGATTSTTPSSPTSTSLSPAAQDADDAAAAVGTFWSVVDRIGSDPKSKIEDLNTVARDAVNAQWTKNLFDRRVRGERFIGHTSVAVESSAPSGKSREYEVTVCLDVSKLNVVDAAGKSIVPANRSPNVHYVYGVTQDGGTSKWYVTTEKATGAC